MLAIAGGDSRIEISTLTDDHNALQTAKVNELPNMDKLGVVEVVDRPRLQQVLSTCWVCKQRLDGSYKVRLLGRGFEQTVSSDTDFYGGKPQLTTVRALLTIAAIHGHAVAYGDCHSAFHHSRCQVNQSQCMWSQHRKHTWTLPKYAFARKLFKDSRFLIRPGVFTAHRKSTT